MALTRVSRHIIDEPFNPTTVSATDVTATNINASGIGTVGTLNVTGNLTVQGTTTTLDTILTEVDKLEVGANNSTVGVAITQSGSGANTIFTGGYVRVNTDVDSALELNATDDGPVYSSLRRSGTRVAYYGFGGSASTFNITNEVANGQLIIDTPSHFSVNTNNTERIRVTSGGSVGIGLTNPTQKLELLSTGNTIVKLGGASANTTGIIINRGGSEVSRIAHSNSDDLSFYTTSSVTERLRITSDGKVRVPDNGKFVAGADDDLEIYHDNINSFIKSNTNELKIAGKTRIVNNGNTESIALFEPNGGVTLFYDNDSKLETTTTGATVTGTLTASGTGGGSATLGSHLDLGDNQKVRLGGGDDLQIYHDGSNSRIDNSFGELIIKNNADDRDIILTTDNGSGSTITYLKCDGSTGAVELSHYGSLKLSTAAGGVNVAGNINLNGADNYEIRLGANNDLKLFHDGSNNYILGSSGNIILKNSTGDYFIGNNSNGAVELLYNNSKKLETTTTGAKVTGALEVTQEYPSIRPTLDLNFAATKTLDRRITFTRDSLGTYTDDMGILKYASNNTPRFDHDFGTGESLGLLIEESRTNLLSYSTSFNLWSSISLMSISVNNQTAPDETQTAANFIFPTNPATIPYCTQTYTYSAAAHTFSVFAKYNGIQYLWLNMWDGAVSRRAIFDIQNGTLGSTQNSPSGQTITAYGNGWYRCTITATTSAGSGDVSIRFANSSSDFDSDTITGNGSDGQYIWGAQLEEGRFATSYIPTSGSTVTRAADLATIKGTNFTDFYNQNEGTLFSEFTIKDETYSSAAIANINQEPGSSYAYSIMFVEVGTANGYFGRTYKNSSGINISNSSSVLNSLHPSTTPQTVSFGYTTATGGTLAAYWNGNFVNSSSDLSKVPTTLTNMRIGTGWSGSNVINAHIRKLSYYPKRLPNAQLQGLTQQ